MAARTNYVLIDYENVQPTDLALLRDAPVKVKVFLGANQAKIPVALAAALQGLGANAEYVLLESSGSNALDFHIAYYIGLLSAQEATAFFHIISKDTGFDPLVKHLKDQGSIRTAFRLHIEHTFLQARASVHQRCPDRRGRRPSNQVEGGQATGGKDAAQYASCPVQEGTF